MSAVYRGTEHNIKLNEEESSYIEGQRKSNIIPVCSKGYGGDWITFRIIIKRMKKVNKEPTRKFAD